jgi:NADP-dependent 3-hydroxy acid dehydrogenase YdfG
VIAKECGRLDILVSNAGMNILERSWEKLRPDSIKTMLDANLNSAFYCSSAALGIMRPQKDGLLIHTASWAGRFAGIVPGPAYVAAKHGVVAMSHTINMEEFQHGIRSTVLCPAEVATPILDLRPTPVPPEERARMIQPEHMADLILYVAKLPATICINEVVISPTWNRGYAHLAGLGPKR